MIDSEKKEFGAWWLWMLGLIVLSSVVFTAMSYVGVIGRTVVERKVFENSYQRSEAYAERNAILEASLQELRSRRAQSNLSDATREEIDTQISAITARLAASRRMQ